MRTFFDVIEFNDVDIDRPDVFFYLIHIQGHEGEFKLCALTCPLYTIRLDPMTTIKTYWSIKRSQLNLTEQGLVLFPNNKLRDTPLTLEDVNKVLHFNPPFDPNKTPQSTFGKRPFKDAFFSTMSHQIRMGRELMSDSDSYRVLSLLLLFGSCISFSLKAPKVSINLLTGSLLITLATNCLPRRVVVDDLPIQNIPRFQ